MVGDGRITHDHRTNNGTNILEREQTLKDIYAQMDRMGDLPVFSASVNRIHLISINPDSNAMDLAQEVMKDVSLTTKLLRLANSPHYNRGLGKIGSISRAVILLGFNTVKNLGLTLKFIESFQHGGSPVDMSKILVRSYLAAGFVCEVAIKCGIRDAEESYICALLHNLGEVACAYFLPDRYAELLALRKTQTMRPREAELAVLGMSMMEVGKALAINWGFPPAVTNTMGDHLPGNEASARSGSRLNGALSSLASRVLDQLYAEHVSSDQGFHQLLGDLAKAAGLDIGSIEHCLSVSFRKSCDLATEFGLNRKILHPVMRESEDESRDKMARSLAYYAANQGSDQPSVSSIAQHEAAAVGDSPTGNTAIDAGHRGNPSLQLAIIQQITDLITEAANPNKVFLKVLEGIHLGVGFERAMLCLLSPDRVAYAARIALGKDAEDLKRYFSFPVDTGRDLFSKVLMEGNELMVDNAHAPAWRSLIRDDFFAHIKASGFMLSALRHRNKPVGLFYADNAISSTPITAEERRGFSQFVAQAKLALLHINK